MSPITCSRKEAGEATRRHTGSDQRDDFCICQHKPQGRAARSRDRLQRIFLVHTPEQGYLKDDHNHPTTIKRSLLEKGVPCQMVDTPTLQNADWKDLNLALNITEQQRNSLTDFATLLHHQAAEPKLHECVDTQDNSKTICLIFDSTITGQKQMVVCAAEATSKQRRTKSTSRRPATTRFVGRWEHRNRWKSQRGSIGQKNYRERNSTFVFSQCKF